MVDDFKETVFYKHNTENIYELTGAAKTYTHKICTNSNQTKS